MARGASRALVPLRHRHSVRVVRQPYLCSSRVFLPALLQPLEMRFLSPPRESWYTVPAARFGLGLQEEQLRIVTSGQTIPGGPLRLATGLRILYLVPYLARGGTERHLIDLIRTIGWKERPWVIAPDGPARPAVQEAGACWQQAPAFGANRRSVSGWRAAIQAAVESFYPDIIHVHAGVELLWVARRIVPEVPRVFTVHGYHGSGAGLSYRLAEVLGGRWADRVIAVSRAEAARLRRLAPHRLRTVLNGVADVQREPLPPPVDGMDGNGLVVAVASRLEPPKGVDLVVEAFIRLKQKRIPVVDADGRPAVSRLVIIGSGSQEEVLRRRVAESGFGDDIRLVGFHPRAAALFRRADIVVQASRQEPFGLTAAEALAAGAPVIVSNAGGLPEVVEDGVSGLVVPAGQVEPLEAALARLLADPDLRSRMGAAARRRYEELFTIERFAADTLGVYRELRDDDGPEVAGTQAIQSSR